MQRLIVFMALCMFLAVGAMPAQVQGGVALIRMLDHNNVETTTIVDGNTVRLSLRLSAGVKTAAQAAFFLDGVDQAVTGCALSAGAASCTSTPIPTLGWYWDVGGVQRPQRTLRVKIDNEDIAGTLQVEVRPRPVVMVHGFISNWETWSAYLGDTGYLASIGLQGFAVGDGQVPGVLNTGSVESPANHTNSIAQNAEILGTYIAGVQQKTGAEKVDLVVHSMGGMISRYYVDRVMQDNNVAQVIFLGTPMSGSACVYPVTALGLAMPASLEIQPSYMVNIFNQQITHRHGIPFYMVAGTFLTDQLASPCATAPSDMVVAFDSATSIPLDGVQRVPLIHSDLTSSPDVFDKGVRPKLQSPPGSFAPRPDPAVPAASYQPEQFTRAYTGHIDPGHAAQVTVNIDPNVRLANFSLYDSSHSLDIEVRGASGKVIQLDAQTNGLLKVGDPQVLFYLGYGFAQPKPGAWVVTLKATAQTPPQGADYALDARFLGGASLDASTSATVPALGQAVMVNAHLQENGSALQVESATALVRRPDGTSESVVLSANGDGYTATYRPKQVGLYSLQVSVAGQTAAGVQVDRAAYLTFEVQPPAQAGLPLALIVVVAGIALALVLLGLVLLSWLVWRRRKVA